MFHDDTRARVQLDEGHYSAWFNVCQGLRQGCVLSPLLFNIFFAAFIVVVLQRFAEDPLIVSDLVYLDDAPKGEDNRPREEGTLKFVRRVVWGMLFADDPGVVATSPRELIRMMDVIVVACQEFGLTVLLKKKTEDMPLWSHPSTASNALRIEAAGQRYSRRPSLCTFVVLSSRAQTLTPRSSVASAPLGQVSENTVPNCTTDGTPGCCSTSDYLKRR